MHVRSELTVKVFVLVFGQRAQRIRILLCDIDGLTQLQIRQITDCNGPRNGPICRLFFHDVGGPCPVIGDIVSSLADDIADRLCCMYRG